jgi:hypothetical protein
VNRSGRPEGEATFHPKMGRRRGPDRERIPPLHVSLARTAPQRGGGSRKGRARNQLGRVAVREPHSLSRRCVIKTRYVSTTTSSGRSGANLPLLVNVGRNLQSDVLCLFQQPECPECMKGISWVGRFVIGRVYGFPLANTFGTFLQTNVLPDR